MANTKREIWAKRVERWQASDLTCNEFAAEIGVNPRTLTHWKWMLGRSAADERKPRKERASRKKVSFTELMPTPLAASPPPIEIVASRGLVIRVTQAFDEDTLRRVLGVVEGTA